MLEKLKELLNDQFALLEGKRLLVACSGGVDSVVLTHLLKKLGCSIALAHCNFNLRGSESDLDEEFVVKLADKMSIQVFNTSFDTKSYAQKRKLSTQMSARELRYKWFEDLCTEFSYDFVLTGHQLDDDLETFFINLSRGTGLRGLTGIPQINDRIVRPLLSFSRAEIITYAQENKIKWREDSSNAETDYLRNKLRIDVLPKYKEAANNSLQTLRRTQDHLKDSQLLVNDYMALIKNLIVTKVPNGYEIDIKKLNDLPNAKALLYELLNPYGFSAWEDIYSLLTTQPGKQVFSKTHRILKDRDALVLTEKNEKVSVENWLIHENSEGLKEPIHLKIHKVKKIGTTNKNTVYIDKNKLVYPLELRSWKEGEYFYPYGMKGKKKLSKFFKDEKLSLVAKEKIWVLSSDNEVVWIVGMRPDDRFKVEKDTLDIISITLID